MDEALEMRRMLEWFKARLPHHDLEQWDIEARPEPPPIPIEGALYPLQPRSSHRFRIVGWARCQRCGARFDIPSMGNALTSSEDRIPKVVEEMKEWVEREADKPCWGDVPTVRDDDMGVIPVMDSTT